MAQAVAPALATAFSGRRLETCRAPAPTSDLVASPWAPDRRCRAQAAVSRRSLLQAAVCASVARPTRVSAATFQAPAVSFLPPASTIPQRQELRTSMPKPHPGPPAFVQATGRIIAIGDIHGDLQKALACLEMAGVLAEDDGHIRWVGGDTTVVQLGDVLDRGDCEIGSVLLLRELDRQARQEGGAVYMLNGNHESLNVAGDFRYVTPGAFFESARAAGLSESDIAAGDQRRILQARWYLYQPGGAMARELAKNPTVLVVNDIVFAHGGLLPHHLKYGLQRLNDEVTEWMTGAVRADGSQASPPFPAMGDSNSVQWNRTFGKERVSDYERMHMNMQLRATLEALNARAMVVGHTPQMGGVNCECDGRIWRADAGMSSGVLNATPQVLEFSKDEEGQLVARMLRQSMYGVECHAYHCKEGLGCSYYTLPGSSRGCYTYTELPPEQQRSIAPGLGDAGVNFYQGWEEGAPEVVGEKEKEEAMRFDDLQTMPHSQCDRECSGRGFCVKLWKEPTAQPFCRCHRGWDGGACETDGFSWCTLGCGGKGKCQDFFCHCQPPYFSIGCSRNSSVPAAQMKGRPNQANFKIYMYELPGRFGAVQRDPGSGPPIEGNALYAADFMFLEQFVHSPVRTEDPSEASLFYVPVFPFALTGPGGDSLEYVNQALDYLRTTYPYWNRTAGRDHFFFTMGDRGSCHLHGLAAQPIKLTHFGYMESNPRNSTMETIWDMGTQGWSCYHPLRDVVVPPLRLMLRLRLRLVLRLLVLLAPIPVQHDLDLQHFARNGAGASMDAIVANKTKLLFFFGGSWAHEKVPEYSGNSRQVMDLLDQEWKDPDIEFVSKHRTSDSPDGDEGIAFWEWAEQRLWRNRWCFSPYGWGWGNRLPQSVLGHCLPITVQDKVVQAFEDILPYEQFSLRLTNEDLPQVREILRNVTDAQYREMMAALIKHRDAFHWHADAGGRAFDYTIASLRRRYHNFKAGYLPEAEPSAARALRQGEAALEA
ncbi:ser thr phosphatase [Micractinium conductrix]|uniref:Ser thr phosphatase n=1 Tax=Micractinium conductrix TaxID=554055 RepID=A0A2P6V7V9_9CHLO|nr:ser thr phosphatase [Micractinium conductrix]|eukprot:PSC70174.1 ser thr phosphatase [Micractinium conductrix]